MFSIDNWAAKAARRICITVNNLGPRALEQVREERIAAIIALHAEPLAALLRESKREHDDGYMATHEPCVVNAINPEALGGQCTCGADAWNARVDAVLGEL